MKSLNKCVFCFMIMLYNVEKKKVVRPIQLPENLFEDSYRVKRRFQRRVKRRFQRRFQRRFKRSIQQIRIIPGYLLFICLALKFIYDLIINVGVHQWNINLCKCSFVVNIQSLPLSILYHHLFPFFFFSALFLFLTFPLLLCSFLVHFFLFLFSPFFLSFFFPSHFSCIPFSLPIFSFL